MLFTRTCHMCKPHDSPSCGVLSSTSAAAPSSPLLDLVLVVTLLAARTAIGTVHRFKFLPKSSTLRSPTAFRYVAAAFRVLQYLVFARLCVHLVLRIICALQSAMSDTTVGQVSVGTAKMIGFLLAICGNTLIACSLTLQKKAHNSVEPDSHLESDARQQADDPESQQLAESSAVVEQQGFDTSRLSETASTSELHFLRNSTWWLGTFLMAAGEIGNFAAFAFAPASLIAPLGAWSVVLSAVLAHIFLQEHVSNSNLLGIALCVTGAFLIGAAGPDVSAAEASLDAGAVTRLLLRTPFVVFILLTLTATACLIYLSHRTTLGQRYIFIYVGVSSLLGGVTVVCAKALSTFLRLTIEGNSQFGNLLPFVLVVILAVAILAQLRYLNMAMAQFGNAQVIPVYYVLFTSCAMTSGVIMYREFDALTSRNIPFFLGICSTMSGVFLVSKSVKTQSREASNAKLNTDSTKNSSGPQYAAVPISPISSPRGSGQPVWP